MNEKDRDQRSIPFVLWRDPPIDPSAAAETLPQAIPSSGVNLNAVLYSAAGLGPHPTVLLLHGLPGNEQNLDCAQAIRRAGWSVLTFHYRGSWGGPGKFTLTHCLDDAAAALDWLQDRGNSAKFRIDPHRIVIMGHSMGGFVAAVMAAEHPDILGTALISGVDITRAFGGDDEGHGASAVDKNVGISAGLHILAGTSPDDLADEARRNSAHWHLTSYALRLAGRPLLTVTSDDGFAAGSDALADAVQNLGGKKLKRVHLAADHSYSNCRIELQVELLNWLQALLSP
jgi:pimeloyl-ACP methyl ester carboxylesterase